uniref:EF-hand domain-containing protein n=1 Tax=Suricata suricatta TaxID=37032 RepID=A0A673TY09_SURSU
MPKLLQGIVTVIDTFYLYATQDGECDMLNKAELKELLENEFQQIMKNPDDPDTVDIIMQNLDQDHDKKVNFTEYLLMIFKLAQACNKIIGKDYCQASGSKQRDHSHQHQEEQNETEDEDRRQGHSMSSTGENNSYSRGSRRSIKHRPRSSSRRMGHQEGLSSSEHRQSSGERRESSSGHFRDSQSSSCSQHGSSSGQCSSSEQYGSGPCHSSSSEQCGSRSGQCSSSERYRYGSCHSSTSGQCGSGSGQCSSNEQQGRC